MLTVREVAKRLHVSQAAVYKAVGEGRLAHYRFGSAIRVSEAQLAEFLDGSQVDGRVDSQPVKDLIAAHLGPGASGVGEDVHDLGKR